jgi:hypothetical protein
MKTASFLFAVVGLGALSLGLGFADPPSAQTSGQESNPNHAGGDHPAPTHGNQTSGDKDQTDIRHSPSDADNHTPGKVSQAGSTQTPLKRPLVNNLSQPAPGLIKTTPAVAKGGSPVNKPWSTSAQFARPPVGGGTVALGPGIAGKPAGVTANLGGLSASSVKTSTAGINGTGMKRTPFR